MNEMNTFFSSGLERLELELEPRLERVGGPEQRVAGCTSGAGFNYALGGVFSNRKICVGRPGPRRSAAVLLPEWGNDEDELFSAAGVGARSSSA